jgi:hypothetical protein
LRSDVWSHVLSLQKADFDPNLELCRAAVLEFVFDDKAAPRKIWAEVFPVLVYASRVEGAAANTDKLVQMLDKFDRKFPRTITSERHPSYCSDTSNGFGDEDTKVPRSRECFLELMSAFGFSYYTIAVISKGHYSQETLRWLFVRAVLGPQVVRSLLAALIKKKNIPDLNIEKSAPGQRLTLVKFLHGRLDKTNARKAANFLREEVNIWPQISPPPNAEWENYWESVQKLVNDKKGALVSGVFSPFSTVRKRG